jgi:hypothetical protein
MADYSNLFNAALVRVHNLTTNQPPCAKTC